MMAIHFQQHNIPINFPSSQPSRPGDHKHQHGFLRLFRLLLKKKKKKKKKAEHRDAENSNFLSPFASCK